MSAIRQKVKTILGAVALLLAGAIAGAAVSALVAPAPIVAHPCEQDECDKFLFFSWCTDNSGRNTACSKAPGGGCETDPCNHP